jgi:hypothetical protein
MGNVLDLTFQQNENYNWCFRLSGYSPFAGDNDHETFQYINNVDYDYDDEVWENVSADGKDFIKKLLCKDKK